MKSLFAIFPLVLLLCGCGPGALPNSTSKMVTAKDIEGTWEYPADYGETTIRLELKTGGTFVQTITRTGVASPQVHAGKWTVEGTRPLLKVLKPVFGDSSKPWIEEEAYWWIMESEINRGRQFSICGAARDYDPDNCFEMKFIK
ncbi:MAG: hypothetical protein R3F11_09265 [Verrucomicrobiales bacterium]